MNAPLVQVANTKALKLAPESEWVVGESFDVKAWLDVAAQTTDGIRQVRGLVLDLAVRGMLVRQDPRDETASRLLERIDGTRSKQDGSEVEARFPIPTSWVWSTLGRVCSYIQRGKSPTYADDSDVPVVSQKCVQWEGFLLDRARFVDPNSLAAYAEERFLRPGDLLWNSTGHGTVGRVAVYVRSSKYSKVVADSHVTVLRPTRMEPRFIWCWLASPSVQRTIDDLVSGTTKQTELSTSTVVAHAVPVPPLAEQKRIVAKVDNLMRMLDDLEARQTKKRETQTRFRSAALGALTSAESQDELDAAWTRIERNFEMLFDTAESVSALRQALIDVCVAGPSGWPIQSVRDFVLETRYGTARKCSRDSTLTPVLRIPNVVRGTLDLEDLKYTSFPATEFSDLRLRAGDVLVVRSNGSRDLVGRACVVDRRAEGFAFAGYLIRVRLHEDAVLPGWFQLSMQSSTLRRSIEGPARTTSGVHNVNTKELLNLAVPVPPLDTQAAVLHRVAKMLKLCDDLEAKLQRSAIAASKLVEAVVADMVA